MSSHILDGSNTGKHENDETEITRLTVASKLGHRQELRTGAAAQL